MTRQRLWQIEHEKKGLCMSCSQPIEKAGRCAKHRAIFNDRQRGKYRKKVGIPLDQPKWQRAGTSDAVPPSRSKWAKKGDDMALLKILASIELQSRWLLLKACKNMDDARLLDYCISAAEAQDECRVDELEGR